VCHILHLRITKCTNFGAISLWKQVWNYSLQIVKKKKKRKPSNNSTAENISLFLTSKVHLDPHILIEMKTHCYSSPHQCLEFYHKISQIKLPEPFSNNIYRLWDFRLCLIIQMSQFYYVWSSPLIGDWQRYYWEHTEYSGQHIHYPPSTAILIPWTLL